MSSIGFDNATGSYAQRDTDAPEGNKIADNLLGLVSDNKIARFLAEKVVNLFITRTTLHAKKGNI